MHISFSPGARSVLISLTFLAILLTALGVPPHMDEYVSHHLISCLAYPEAQYNIYREACGGFYDLNVWGHWLPLRSFHYTGFSTALLYFPLFKLFPHYLSAKLLNALFLLGFAGAAAKLLRLPVWLAGVITATFFPLAYPMINDTGPVALQCMLVALIPLVFLKMGQATSALTIIGFSLLTGLLCFSGLEQKPVFLYVLPAILGLCMVSARTQLHQQSLKVLLLRSLPGTALFLSLSANLLSAQTHSGETYYAFLLSQKDSPLLALSGQWEHFSTSVSYFILDFTNFSHRVYSDNLSYHSLGLLLTLLFWGPSASGPNISWPAVRKHLLNGGSC